MGFVYKSGGSNLLHTIGQDAIYISETIQKISSSSEHAFFSIPGYITLLKMVYIDVFEN